jgi:hypothetical protein
MRHLSRCAVTAFALCAGFGQFDTTVSGAERAPSSMPVSTATAGLLVVRVAINDRGEYPFLLDTGSESTLVDPALATELGLVATSRHNLLTSTGTVSVVGSTASLVFGAVEAREALVLHLPLDTVRAYAPQVRGVLGHDVLRRANWLLDYNRGTVTQDVDGVMSESRCGERLPLHWINGRPAISAGVGRMKRDLILDSASRRVVLFGGAEDLEPTDRISIAGLSGREHVPGVIIESLRFGSLVVPGVRAAIVTASAQHEGGILPTALFGSVYFDYRSDSIVVTPPK